MTLSKEVLQTPSWYFLAPSELYYYTLTDNFTQEPPEVQSSILWRLSEMEQVRPEDINMKVTLG